MPAHQKTPVRNARVRFAPSPTGFLHVGGARTAIFNWLFARHERGTLVLRIEDTDVERSTRESEASLLEDLRWLGLDWDEGPDVGGPHGPYRQSERLDLYRAAAESLVERGLAFPCFCSDDDLARKRVAALEAGKPPQYDGTCRRLRPGAVAERRRDGAPETVRFRVPDGNVVFDDLVRSTVSLDTGMVGDFVILRSNGLPTYNFAAAHDDLHMKITHVLRGEEHLSNTLRQTLVYRALGEQPPVFGHLPLILAQDRSKLSKRHGASSVGELRQRGFLPDAVVNYLVLLGWSHPEGAEKMSRGEMTDAFTLGRTGKAAAVYDPKKLAWMNAVYIRELAPDDWVRLAEPFLPGDVSSEFDAPGRRAILETLQDAVEKLTDLTDATRVFVEGADPDREAAEVLSASSTAAVLGAVIAELETVTGDWTPDAFKSALKRAGINAGVKGKALFFPVRAALTGRIHGPDLSRIAAVRGRKSVLRVLRARAG